MNPSLRLVQIMDFAIATLLRLLRRSCCRADRCSEEDLAAIRAMAAAMDARESLLRRHLKERPDAC